MIPKIREYLMVSMEHYSVPYLLKDVAGGEGP